MKLVTLKVSDEDAARFEYAHGVFGWDHDSACLFELIRIEDANDDDRP